MILDDPVSWRDRLVVAHRGQTLQAYRGKDEYPSD